MNNQTAGIVQQHQRRRIARTVAAGKYSATPSYELGYINTLSTWHCDAELASPKTAIIAELSNTVILFMLYLFSSTPAVIATNLNPTLLGDFRDVPTAPFYPPPPGHPTSTFACLCRGMHPAEQESVVKRPFQQWYEFSVTSRLLGQQFPHSLLGRCIIQ